MPQFQDSIQLPGTESGKILAIAYETFKTLGWSMLFAGEDQIVGNTPKNWKTKGQQFLPNMSAGELTVQSKMVNGESFDPAGRNKKCWCFYRNF